jgi:hypothetical protein
MSWAHSQVLLMSPQPHPAYNYCPFLASPVAGYTMFPKEEANLTDIDLKTCLRLLQHKSMSDPLKSANLSEQVLRIAKIP